MPADPWVQTDMTEHLMDAHGVTPAALRRLWERRVDSLSASWDDVLDANHDLLHSLADGGVVKGGRGPLRA